MATYTWKKYNATIKDAEWVETTETVLHYVTIIKGLGYTDYESSVINAYSGYTVNETTGEVTLTGGNSCYFHEYDDRTHPYIYNSDGAARKVAGWNIIEYDNSDTTGYELILAEPITVSLGSYISDVTSSNISTYPKNGIHTDGYWYVLSSAIQLGDSSVGDIVKLNVNGVAANFIVVHQGNPDSSIYDSSCNGTWLLMEDVYEKGIWDSSDNDYANSDIHSYLNNTFLNLFDSSIKNAIKQVKIPYIDGTGSGGSLATGTSGLSTKAFLLSYTEVGFSGSSYVSVEGAVLSYFDGAANSKRIAKLDGTNSRWWIRSPYKSSKIFGLYVDVDGNIRSSRITVSEGVHPALVLPYTLIVDSDGNVIVNTAPGKPGIPSFSEPEGGKALTVSWSAATDADGNLSGYILECSLDGGSWTQIYKGSALSYSYTVPKGTETIAFRVKAYDSYNAESSYATSSTVAVSNDIIGIQGANAIIGGIQKDLTGVGYVCIAGVWKSLVNSYTCIDGIWKSMIGGVDLADLPDGYTQLEYIESSGTQYIDTAFVPNQDTRIDISVMAFSTANAGAGTGFIPYGAGVNYNSNAFECYTSGEQLEFNYANEKAYVCDAITNSIYNISHNKAAVSVTGAVNASYTFPYTAISVPRTMTLFAINRASVLISDSMRLYSCQIYDNDVLIRDFVPCINSSGEVGLYDMVNKMFYSNAGTSVFTAGKPVNSTFYPLPGNFASAEYIQSSGTQWIDTGFIPNTNTRIVMDVENLTATASTGYFGTRSAASGTNPYSCTFFTNINGEANMRLDYYGSSKTISCNSLQRLQLDWNKNVTTIGDITTVTSTASSNSSTYNLCLLAINTAGSPQFGANAKLYSCQIYDNGTLIRDYIPCANANGEAGLWDKVNGIFYGNSGTGEFTAG